MPLRNTLKLTAALLLALSGMPSAVDADFRLDATSSKGDTRTFILRFHLDTSAEESLPASLSPHVLEEFGEMMDPDWVPPADSRSATSALLAVDAVGKPEAWAIDFLDPAVPAEAFTLRPVQAGPWSALQVIAHTELIPDGTWELRITGPAADRSRQSASRQAPESEAVTRGLFLNGHEPVTLAQPGASSTSGPRTVWVPPAPPAPWRVRYQEGRRVVLVPIPGEVASIEQFRALHQGRVIQYAPGPEAGTVMLYLPERTNILSDLHDVVFVGASSSNASAPMGSRPAFETLVPAGTEVALPRREIHRPRLVYERSSPLELGDRFVQYRMNRTQTRTMNYPFHDRLAGPDVTAHVAVAGMSSNASFDPDHYAEFALGGVWHPATASWKGRVVFDHTFSVLLDPLDFPGDEMQEIEFRHHVPAVVGGPPTDTQALDIVELEWVGYPRVGPGHRLVLDVPEAGSDPRLVTVAGFPVGTMADDLILLDVTDETSPVIVLEPAVFADASGQVGVEWEVPAAGGTYLVQLIEEEPETLELSPTARLPLFTDLPGEVLHGIYVCPPELRDSLQPLLDLRGPGYVVLDPNAAYDLYSHGQESPEAIHYAIKVLLASSKAHVPFPTVVLVGHATLDRRNYLGHLTAPQVPTFIDESVDVSFTIENSVDYPYGLIYGNDELVDANLSRLPAKSAEELDLMVERILDHEAAAADLSEIERHGIFYYDDDAGFLLDQAQWAGLWAETGRPIREIVLDPSSNGNAEKAEFIAAMEEEPRGPAFVTYIGHGNNGIWSSRSLLRTADIPVLDTRGGYPFVTTFTCLNANYAFPTASSRSMGETWLLVPVGRGAGASYAPVSVDFYFAQRVKLRIFLELMAQHDRPQTTGELVTRTRLAFAIERPDLIKTNREYVLFADALAPLTIAPSTPTSVRDWSDLQHP